MSSTETLWMLYDCLERKGNATYSELRDELLKEPAFSFISELDLEDVDDQKTLMRLAKLSIDAYDKTPQELIAAIIDFSGKPKTTATLLELESEAIRVLSGENKDRQFLKLTWEALTILLDYPISGDQLESIVKRPEEFIDRPEVPQDADPLIQFLVNKSSARNVFRLTVRMQIRGLLERYQINNQITGLKLRTFAAAGKTIQYLSTSPFNLIEGDAAKLKPQVPSIVEFFISLAQENKSIYDLSFVSYEDAEDGESLPTTYAAIRELATKAADAWLHQSSTQWGEMQPMIYKGEQTQGRIGKHIERRYPDEIDLFLDTVAGSYDDKSFHFRLTNKDVSHN